MRVVVRLGFYCICFIVIENNILVIMISINYSLENVRYRYVEKNHGVGVELNGDKLCKYSFFLPNFFIE